MPRLALLAIVLLTIFVRPGDTPWINDEPKLFHLALLCNSGSFADVGIHVPFTSATLGVMGLYGTRGARYGPVPVWIYQCFLLLTHDPVLMVQIHALLFGVIIAVSLDWLTSTMEVNPWLAVVTMLSPWLWFYSRQLWDNSFCIPFSVLLLAAYASFLKTAKIWPLCVAALAAGLLVLTHLMCLALLVPLLAHALLFRGRQILRRPLGLLAALAVFAALQFLAWPYWKWMRMYYQSAVEAGRSPVAGYFYPLLGGHHLSAAGLGNLLGDNWQNAAPDSLSNVIYTAEYVSVLAYIAVWIGIFLAFRRARRVIRRQESSVADHLAFIAIGALIFQCLLDGTQRVYEGPHYFNSTWIAFAVLAYLAVNALPIRWQSLLLAVQAAALVTVLSCMIFIIAHNGGTLTPGWGTTIAQQADAVREIGNTPLVDGEIAQQPFDQWHSFPWEYDVLKAIINPQTPPKPGVQAQVAYQFHFVGDAHIEVDFYPD
ncbi:MAG: hypothetical protein ABSF29_01430 [Tepidisphaeraceae bacterium]